MNHRSRALAGGSWRVAVGGNRVQNMTPEEIARAFRAGQLNERTPLWPPGTSGWQALGNFEQFRIAPASIPPISAGPIPGGGAQDSAFASTIMAGTAPQPAMPAPGQLASYDEEEEDPTRMWTGVDDATLMVGGAPEGMPGAAPVTPPPASQAGLPYGQPRAAVSAAPVQQVAAPVQPVAAPAPVAPPPAPRPMAPPPGSAAPAAAPLSAPVASRRPGSPVSANPAFRPPEERRGGGMTLVVGVLGLFGLGAAMFAARGEGGSLFGGNEAVATSPMGVQPANKKPPATPAAKKTSAAVIPAIVPAADLKKLAGTEGSGAAQLPASSVPSPSGENLVAKTAEQKSEPNSDGDGEIAETTPQEDAEEESPKSKLLTAREKRKAKAKKKRKAKARLKRIARAEAKAEAKADAKAEAKAKRVARAKAKRLAKAKAKAAPSSGAPSKTVKNNASKALAKSAKLALSCRPRGGPSGPGKVRVIYDSDGSVRTVEILTAKFRDTLTGSCIRLVFRRAKIPAFGGKSARFIKGFSIPDQ